MNAFIVGAGFTKAVFPAAPLNPGLLEALAQKAPDSSAYVLRERYKTDDIENRVLTRLDADIAVSQSESRADRLLMMVLRSDVGLKRSWANHFHSFVACEALLARAPWLAQLVDDVFSPGDVVISLNYDCVFEGALDCRGKWSPKGWIWISFRSTTCLRRRVLEKPRYRPQDPRISKLRGRALLEQTRRQCRGFDLHVIFLLHAPPRIRILTRRHAI